jgi:autotransporter-associated beta strand protein
MQSFSPRCRGIRFPLENRLGQAALPHRVFLRKIRAVLACRAGRQLDSVGTGALLLGNDLLLDTTMKNKMTAWRMIAMAVAALSGSVAGESADPTDIIKKPIPDKLVVLTFDDGPASHYNAVAPILKRHGFSGSFYICDFDSFRTRKDWYLTWRQMREMAADGLEIGNHTSGHAGGASIGYFLTMEDALLANGIPRPVTVAWPVYQSNPKTYPDLAANGYTFGRGGYNRPYRPTVDNPFDIPSMGSNTVEEFVKSVRQAAGGRIVVLTYHGIPDIEHAAVSLDPAIFKAQMQYLKDNHYKVIALRDLAEYIDPAKAAKLPPTPRDYQPTGTEPLASQEKPAVSAVIPTPPAGTPPAPARIPEKKLDLPELAIPADGGPITLDGERTVNVPKGPPVDLRSVLSGSGKLVKTGEGELRLADVRNTHGGTVIHGGTLTVRTAQNALGSGPVTLNDGMFQVSRISGTNPLILNGGTFHAADGFGSSWDADITLNGEVIVSAYNSLDLNTQSGGIRGPGGLVMAGNMGPWGRHVNEGRLTLGGTNHYTGPTVVRLGTLVLAKAAALYGADTARWTAENLGVHRTATLVLKCGGPDEFTGEQLKMLLQRLTDTRASNGLMAGAILCLDTGNAISPFMLNAGLTDARRPDGGGFDLRKSGDGTLVLSGNNTFTGRTHIERGMLSVSSLNSIGKGRKSYSNLGAPGDIEAGEILLGQGDGTVPKGDGPCGLIYTGSGETSDRIMNLCGMNSVVTFEQAGSGLFKLTSPVVISGYGANKDIVLSGSTAGTGEFAGDLADPFDRTGKAMTSLTKAGSGAWTLSGTNTHTGPTMVKQGTLRIADGKCLGNEANVQIAQGAKLELDFNGEIAVAKLTLEGKSQPAGKYSAANFPASIAGKGVLSVR